MTVDVTKGMGAEIINKERRCVKSLCFFGYFCGFGPVAFADVEKISGGWLSEAF